MRHKAKALVCKGSFKKMVDFVHLWLLLVVSEAETSIQIDCSCLSIDLGPGSDQ